MCLIGDNTGLQFSPIRLTEKREWNDKTKKEKVLVKASRIGFFCFCLFGFFGS